MSSLSEFCGCYNDYNHGVALKRWMCQRDGRYFLHGVYADSDIHDDGDYVGDARVKAGQRWEVPIEEGVAIFAGNKSAKRNCTHANYTVAAYETADGKKQLRFNPMGTNRDTTVNVWKKVEAVVDLANCQRPHPVPGRSTSFI